MSQQTVFIDGAVGTTGLEIAERLAGRSEFQLITLADDRRKDPEARREALNEADFAILCLPDDASREAVALIDPASATRVIDASTAFRVAPGWIYGFPELVGKKVVADAKRVSNPGCYPTGFLGLMAPLLRCGLLPRDFAYTVNAVSGYSGGGKQLIARFEDDQDIAFRAYGLALGHKHITEMQHHSGLAFPPVFSPAVVPAHRGMVVDVPLPLNAMRTSATPDALHQALAEYYADSPIVRVLKTDASELLLRKSMAPSDCLDLYVFADEEGSQARLVAMLDNLGKGASGAAVQSLNLMAGVEETAGLALPN